MKSENKPESTVECENDISQGLETRVTSSLEPKNEAENRIEDVEASEQASEGQAQKVAEMLARDLYIICENALSVIDQGSFSREGASDAFLLQNMCKQLMERLAPDEEVKDDK